jgi:multiple sugar transport system substrate-binding protein
VSGLATRRSVLTAGAAMTLLAACGGTGSQSRELTIAVRSHFQPVMEEIVKAYRKERPKLSIRIEQLPDDAAETVQRVTTARIGNQLPDILENLDILVNDLSENNLTADLTPWFERGQGLTLDSFMGDFVTHYRPLERRRELHGLPVSADATVIYYNKELFERAGVPEPSGEWTWEQLVGAARTITDEDREVWGIFPLGDWQANYNPALEAHGVRVFDPEAMRSGIGDAEALPVWRMFTDLVEVGAAVPRDLTKGPQQGPVDQFVQGRIAMFSGVRAQVPDLRASMKAPWDVAPMPTVAGRPMVGGGSYGLSLTSGAEDKQDAWDFLVWFYRTDGGMAVLQQTYQAVPPTRDGVRHGTWRELAPPPTNTDVYADAVAQAVLAPQLPGRSQGVLDQEIANAFDRVMLENVPLGEAFGDAGSAVNAAIAEAS